MIKKILIILFVTILSSSCGKKGDPIYNDKNSNSKKITTNKNLFS